MRRIRVFVHACDPVTEAGLAYLLRSEPSLLVSGAEEIDSAAVAVLAAPVFDDVRPLLAGVQRDGHPPVVLVLDGLDGQAIVEAASVGVRGLVRRSDATVASLRSAIDRVLRGLAVVPDDLVGALIDQASCQGPSVSSSSSLTERERSVLALLADGSSTPEIGDQLGYSERTVKGVIHDITTRLHLRNRPHAVAYALRNGMI